MNRLKINVNYCNYVMNSLRSYVDVLRNSYLEHCKKNN
jgi:hypothetical protein